MTRNVDNKYGTHIILAPICVFSTCCSVKLRCNCIDAALALISLRFQPSGPMTGSRIVEEATIDHFCEMSRLSRAEINIDKLESRLFLKAGITLEKLL